MPPSRLYRTEGIVLRQYRLGEADKALTIYTRDLGKLRAAARGVARPRSRLSGHVEPLTRTSLLLARGRTLDVVSQAQTLESFPPLRDDLTRAASGFYVAELMDSFTPEGLENPPLYDLLLTTLRWLAEGPATETALRYFEMALLDGLGYRPELYRCLDCGQELKPELNYFSPAQGGCLCPQCGAGRAARISLEAQKVLRLFQRGDEATARRLRLSAPLAQELEALLRQYLGRLLEREVRSARFLDRLRAEQ